MNYKVGDKVRIKSREYFIEKYGEKSMPFGYFPNKWQTTGKIGRVIYSTDHYVVVTVDKHTGEWAFLIEDVKPTVTLIDPRSLK